MDAPEDLAGLVDALRAAEPQRIEGRASGAIDSRQAKDMDRQLVLLLQLDPPGFGGKPALSAFTRRPRLVRLADPGPGAVAIDPRGREIANPLQATQLGHVAPVRREHGVAQLIRWNRAQDMGAAPQGRCEIGDRALPLKEPGFDAQLQKG